MGTNQAIKKAKSFGIAAHYFLSELPHRQKFLWWQELGLSYTASGYGGRIPSSWQVQLPGSARWRRVYIACWSNSGTPYVETPNGWVVINY